MKADIIEDWTRLIDKMYDFLQEARAKGGTAGHKAGAHYDKLKDLLTSFTKAHKY